MSNNILNKAPDESNDEYLVRLGGYKESQQLDLTWTELAVILNGNINPDYPKTESYWRKRYHQLADNTEILDFAGDPLEDDGIKKYFLEIEKQRLRAKDERTAYWRQVRSQARSDEILDLFSNEISKYQDNTPYITKIGERDAGKAIYAMLSDIHFGMEFNTVVGKYDTEIARKRIRLYAEKIKEFGVDCADCYVSLMGDMISGIIHPGIRIENKETLIEQVIGVSELVAEFLYDLSTAFKHVYVNSVDGNHSRPGPNIEDSLRTERLDALVPWYCKAKLGQVKNVEFIDNVLDSTIGNFNIFGKLYVSVHGDMERDIRDMRKNTTNIAKLIGHNIDYMLSGHTHVAEYRFESTRYIVNGCVCGSGDDYTMKKRLFGPPVQVCMICTNNGVEAIHPVELGGV